MKNLTIALILFGGTNVYGQKLREGSIKSGTSTFQANKLKHGLMVVNNITNPPDKNVPANSYVKLSQIKLADENSVNVAFSKVFSGARLQELASEKKLVLTFYPNRFGKIKYISFYIKGDTSITAQELGLLEKQLKNYVAYVIPKGEGTSDNIWPVTQWVSLKTVLDKTAVN